MKTILATLFAVLAFAGAAFPAEPKITVADEQAIYNTLAALDGRETPVTLSSTDPKAPPVQKIVLSPYHLTGRAIFVIAKDREMLDSDLRKAQTIRDAEFKKVAPDGKDIPKDDPRFAPFVAKQNSIYSAEPNLPLLKLKESDLDDGTIPGSIVTLLVHYGLIEEEPGASKLPDAKQTAVAMDTKK